MTQHFVWLPTLHGNPNVVEGQSDNAQAFIDAWQLALGERAAIMRPDARLFDCAAKHATWLAQRTGDAWHMSMHIGEGGSFANERVRWAGYRLPAGWPDDANYVESCAAWQKDGVSDGAGALAMLLDSPPHRVHLLGEGWYAHSTVFGVGNSGVFYVVVTCPPEN